MVAADHGEGPPRPEVAVPAAELDTGSDAPVQAVPAAPAVLAEGVRSRVLELAAEALADMATEDVPGSLRRFRSFTPARRARLAARPLSAALAGDQAFRRRVGDWVRREHAPLVTALEAHTAGDAADPVSRMSRRPSPTCWTIRGGKPSPAWPPRSSSGRRRWRPGPRRPDWSSDCATSSRPCARRRKRRRRRCGRNWRAPRSAPSSCAAGSARPRTGCGRRRNRPRRRSPRPARDRRAPR